ncbi:MAG: 30S ribosomal protein S16 [Mucinivorans sp.]
MATKIRLSRHGKKGYAFYHIIVADSRSPRDGKFIENLGVYNPNTNPATIELNFERALYWISTGAQPTDTTRAILSLKGVMMMHHLNGGVTKGALTQEQAQAKFDKWIESKEAERAAEKAATLGAKNNDAKARLAAETKVKEVKAAAIAAKLAEAAKAEMAAQAEAAPAEVATEEVGTEAVAE